jgi:4-hydroxy-3-methylbut-2-enyl diphosphate reductase IspH
MYKKNIYKIFVVHLVNKMVFSRFILFTQTKNDEGRLNNINKRMRTKMKKEKKKKVLKNICSRYANKKQKLIIELVIFIIY